MSYIHCCVSYILFIFSLLYFFTFTFSRLNFPFCLDFFSATLIIFPFSLVLFLYQYFHFYQFTILKIGQLAIITTPYYFFTYRFSAQLGYYFPVMIFRFWFWFYFPFQFSTTILLMGVSEL